MNAQHAPEEESTHRWPANTGLGMEPNPEAPDSSDEKSNDDRSVQGCSCAGDGGEGGSETCLIALGLDTFLLGASGKLPGVLLLVCTSIAACSSSSFAAICVATVWKVRWAGSRGPRRISHMFVTSPRRKLRAQRRLGAGEHPELHR